MTARTQGSSYGTSFYADVRMQVEVSALGHGARPRDTRAAGLEVYEHRPSVTPALLELPNVALLPHGGSAGTRIAELEIDNVRAVLEGREPPSPVI